MRPFDYFSPPTIDEACRLLSDYRGNARLVAGGTDVLVELRKQGAASPNAVIDLSRIADLTGISEADHSVVIKPMTTHTAIVRSPILQRHAPLLCSSAATIGSPQIRNRGTIGGNIMNAAACADTVPPLMALGAEVALRSAAGTRTVLMTDLFVKPYVTTAQPDEVLTAIRFPVLPAGAKSAFIKLGRRNALAISRLSVAAVLIRNTDGAIVEARIVPGSAFPTWRRVQEAEALLLGTMGSTELFAQAGRAVSEVMISVTGRRWSTEYKEPVIAALVRRALEACV